jgi:ubiquinone/menaquinone biosynthesis C-methylase UbiE
MNYYDEISEGYNELHKEEQLRKVEIIIKELKLKGTEKILDVGCGTAFYAGHFGKGYLGIDPSEGMLKKAKGSKTILGSAENLPFEDKSFDVVISITAAQNFKDLEKAIKEIKRVAKKKIAITILKRSDKVKEIEKHLKGFKKLEEEKDYIYIKNVK